jgi:hypothetical protein
VPHRPEPVVHHPTLVEAGAQGQARHAGCAAARSGRPMAPETET